MLSFTCVDAIKDSTAPAAWVAPVVTPLAPAAAAPEAAPSAAAMAAASRTLPFLAAATGTVSRTLRLLAAAAFLAVGARCWRAPQAAHGGKED